MRRPKTQLLNARSLAIVIFAGASLVAQECRSAAIETREGKDLTDDATFLNEIQRRAVLFFMEQSDPVTGLTHDRAAADGATMSRTPASIAATGFALTGWCIADARGWSKPGEALDRVKTVLKFVAEHVEHERGWIYHFIDASTGARVWKSEASTIDTALFLSGAISAREYFDDPEVTRLVDMIYRRVDWQWALNGGTTLTHGWRPETGFIEWRWDSYAEQMGLYLLGIGAPSNELHPETWNAWRREPVVNFAGREFINAGPLFTHQYAHAWFDFRGQRDAHADYWVNSVQATLAQRDWFAEHSKKFDAWPRDMWGLTASDSASGYIAWGGPGGFGSDLVDGTVVPCAPGGSLPFAPEECLVALRAMRQSGGEKVWQRYGFVDAFNPQTGWVSKYVIGIDVGIMLVMAENYRTGLVWKVFMDAPEVQLGMQLAGFQSHPTDPQVQLAAAE
ncbi:MAG TPA: glucoamylase family protein [Opitutaceae bacterium]|nr:glucoamylase family protein [Opitutaceae bacterium]